MLFMPSIGLGLLADALVITRDALIRNSLETHNQTPHLKSRPSNVTGERPRQKKLTTFSRCVNWHTVLDAIKSDNAAPVEGSTMTESAKRRVTADVIILAAGAATLVVLAYVGAL